MNHVSLSLLNDIWKTITAEYNSLCDESTGVELTVWWTVHVMNRPCWINRWWNDRWWTDRPPCAIVTDDITLNNIYDNNNESTSPYEQAITGELVSMIWRRRSRLDDSVCNMYQLGWHGCWSSRPSDSSLRQSARCQAVDSTTCTSRSSSTNQSTLNTHLSIQRNFICRNFAKFC